ncbi:hypothetical protein M0R04_13080 [Candidatus Dojkabacteria bacterium]|jgi:hypothetical protein|nr:hypothetical protein [Candidatus Dojkabacteria bacterium]
MSTVTVDFFRETASTEAHKLYGGWYLSAGQAFTAYPTKISSCKFYLKKVLLPTGNAYAALYDITGTYGSSAKPTGTVLATSSLFDVSTISATDYMLESFTFSTPFSSAYKQYAISLVVPGKTVTATDYILIAKRPATGTNGSHPGNSFVYDTVNGFVAQTGSNDVAFYVYGDDSGIYDPAKIGGRCVYGNTTKHTADSILKNSVQQMKKAKEGMVKAMVQQARIAQRDRALNQKAIKRLAK